MVILPLKINATTRQTITQVGIRIPIKTCTCIGKATIKLTKATKTKIRKKNPKDCENVHSNVQARLFTYI